jgi:tetratricopeptide (TPR) repeat protein
MKLAALVTAATILARTAAADPKTAVDEMRARVRGGNFDEAIAIGEREVRISPRDSSVWLALGEAYGSKARNASVFSQLGLAKKCKAAFEHAVETDPKNVDAHDDLFHFYIQAPGIAGGSVALARAEAGQILRLDASRGHAALAALAANEKNDAAAEAEFKQAIAADRSNFAARIGLGSLWNESKRFGEAKQMWRGLLADSELEMPSRYQLARTCLLSGTDLEEGVAQLKAYLGKTPRPEQPTWADADWRLGLLYEKLGRKTEAIAAWKEALRINPGHEHAKKELKRVGS